MTTTLITGANKGLGRETARRLLELGHTVWIGARNADAGQQAADELGDGAHFVQLDVTDDASVNAAVATITAAGGLDVLINNAGITAGPEARETTAADLEHVYATNVFGLVRVTHAFLPLLDDSEHAVIVNVSSGLGSMSVVNTPDRVEFTVPNIAYTSSKTAVNMVTTQYAKALPQVKVNVIDPGYTGTDLNGNSGPQTVTEGTDAVVAMATIGKDGPTGTFTDRHGDVAW